MAQVAEYIATEYLFMVPCATLILSITDIVTYVFLVFISVIIVFICIIVYFALWEIIWFISRTGFCGRTLLLNTLYLFVSFFICYLLCALFITCHI